MIVHIDIAVECECLANTRAKDSQKINKKTKIPRITDERSEIIDCPSGEENSK